MGKYSGNLRARLRGKDPYASPNKGINKKAPATPTFAWPSPTARPVEGRKATATEAAPERDFFRERRMFAIVGDDIRVASVGDKRYHREWMIDLDQFEFDRAIRGYYLAPDLVAYRASFRGISVRRLMQHAEALKEAMGLPGDTRVYTGARPAAPGSDDLEGQDFVGPLDDLIERAKGMRRMDDFLPAVD